MTAMLASVRNLEEARCVQTCAVDIIDLKDPANGALGAVSHAVAADIVRDIAGQIPISATIGDLPVDAGRIEQAVFNMAKTGVDIIKIGLFDNRIDAAFVNMLDHCRRNRLRIVLVIFADSGPDLPALFASLGRAPLYGIMLDTRDKHSGPLTGFMLLREIAAFLDLARQHALLAGLAGSLMAADIPELLALRPDYLGFRGALCAAGERTSVLSSQQVTYIRNRIPRHGDAPLRDLGVG